MEITVQVPDDVAKQLGDLESMPRQLLEAYAIEGHRTGSITRHQVSQLLGLDYWATDAFLARHGAKQPYTSSDLDMDRKCLSRLSEKRGAS